MSSKFYTPRTVSGVLNITDVCLCLWRRDGIGPPWEKHGHRIYYPVDRFMEYLDRIGQLPAADASAYAKGQFFTAAHRPEPAPETVVEPAVVVELAARMARVEKALDEVRMRLNPPKRTPRKRKRVKTGKLVKRKVRRRVARVPKPTPDDIFPY